MKEAPAPAEASTEVGQDDSPETLGGIVVIGVCMVAVIAATAFFIGFFW